MPMPKGKFNRPIIIPQTQALSPHKLTDSAELTFNDIKRTVHASELKFVKHLGEGAYGFVQHRTYTCKDEEDNELVIHLAVKQIPISNEQSCQQMINRSLYINTSICSHDFLVQYFGAMFYEGDVLLCMEKMDLDMEKFYKKLYNIPELDEYGNRLDDPPTPVLSDMILPECLLAYITYCVVNALKYLKTNLKIIHRDVKPSNILTNINGSVKLCDFGISGPLIDSLDASNKGCRMYLAPERVNPPRQDYKYSIKADVWSLGITILELATGKYPYSRGQTLWQQLNDVVNKPSPTLPPNSLYSQNVRILIDNCLKKAEEERPNYDEILNMAFLSTMDLSSNCQLMSATVCKMLNFR